MPTPDIELAPDIEQLGELLGLLDVSGCFDAKWFGQIPANLEKIPERVAPLLALIDHILGPAVVPDTCKPTERPEPAGNPGAPEAGTNWYPIRNPLDGSPTGLHLVVGNVSKGNQSADIGVGIRHTTGYQDLTIAAYAVLPLFHLSNTASPEFLPGTKPLSIGLEVSSDAGFSTDDGVHFSSLLLDVELFLGTAAPTMALEFVGLSGQPAKAPSKYTSLAAFLDGIENHDVGSWLSAVLLKGTYWLKLYVGRSSWTIGDLLCAACVLSVDENDNYALKLDYLKENAHHPNVLAENFLLNVLVKLSESKEPLIPIPVGAEGSGIYITREACKTGENDSFEYGLRVMIQDIPIAGGKNKNKTEKENKDRAGKPEYMLQLGKWIGKETKDDSWLSRLGRPADPGVAFYLLTGPSQASSCGSQPPKVTFAPRVELISVGIDVRGSAKNPLFNHNGYVLSGAELRVYLRQESSGVTFGAACSLDGLGLPLGPTAAGQGEGNGQASNPVAQNLLSSGSDDKDAKGDKSPVNPSFGLSAAYCEAGNPKFALQLYDKDGNPANPVTIPIGRALGPLQCDKLGVGWDKETHRLSLLFDGGIHAGTLELDLTDLSVGIPLSAPGEFSEYSLDLHGIGITFDSGDVEISAALLETPGGDDVSISYDGEAIAKAGPLGISAIGSYAYMKGKTDQDADGKGYASLMVFGVLDDELGDPTGTGAFFVTGLATGFGYNRALVLPAQDKVPEFPLVAAATDPTALGGTPPNPAKALAGLDGHVPAERGEYWLAAGLRFTSYDLIHSTVLATVEFGQELEIALLGVASISLPPGASEKVAFAELGLEVELLPSAGVLSATAVLSPNSFVLDPACKLTGGFAFSVWFGDNPNAGQWVLTVGGYHPHFTPPPYFPTVPRLGFNWPMPGHVTVHGDAYFALTSSAFMVGGGLEILFHDGNLKAWFKANVDAVIQWAPLHYEMTARVSIGASYRIHFWSITSTLKAELSAEVEIWGPKTGGRAHVHWFVISFTVGFGAGRDQRPPPLDWHNDHGTGFAQTLLPQKDSGQPAVFTMAVHDGLLSTFHSDGNTVWVVTANHFTCSAKTAIPVNGVTLNGAPTDSQPATDPIHVRPMRATLNSSVLSVTLRQDDSTCDNTANFDVELATESVAAGKWGEPLPLPEKGKPLPEPNPNAQISGCMGLKAIRPKNPKLSPAGKDLLSVNVAEAFRYEVVNEFPPVSCNHLPLSPGAQPVGSPPTASNDSLPTIRETATQAVADRRSSVLSTLQEFGVGPLTNGGLETFAEDPERFLNGSPLLAAPALHSGTIERI